MANLLVDRGNLHRGERLAVAVLATVALAPTVLVDEQLLAAARGNHLGADAGARDDRRTDGDGLAVGHQQHLIEGDGARLAGLAVVVGELLDAEGLARLNPVLLPTRCDYGVHT